MDTFPQNRTRIESTSPKKEEEDPCTSAVAMPNLPSQWQMMFSMPGAENMQPLNTFKLDPPGNKYTTGSGIIEW